MLKTALILTLSLFLALLASFIALPGFLEALRPHFVLLVLFYWILAFDLQRALGIAWIMGIALDVLHHTALGSHALGLLLPIYWTMKFRYRILQCPLLQQAVIISGLSLVYFILFYWIQASVGQPPKIGLSWLSVLSNGVGWIGCSRLIKKFPPYRNGLS